METKVKTVVMVQADINATVERVWNYWTSPHHIVHWNNASDDWHTPRAENDLHVGGRFLSRMEARDGSAGFDFTGIYTRINPYQHIEYTLDDGRKVQVSFVPKGKETTVVESFETEQTNPIELQQAGWQAILNNFKKYAEKAGKPGKMYFNVIINVHVEHVYQTMLDERKYREWTAVFNPNSHYKGSWEKGSKILFLGTENNGKQGGMISQINENIPNRFLSIKHLGIVEEDVEIINGPKVEEWAGALEEYYFSEIDCRTLLSVEMDVNEQYRSYFEKTWPKALNKLKAICETR